MPIPVASCQLLRQPSLDPGVFVPAAAPSSSLARPHAVVLDLCCGSGTVGAAVRCARRNIAAHGQVYEGDLYDDPLPAALRGRVDMLVANAPQVPTEAIGMMPPETHLHEARIALDGGVDGLDVQRRVAPPRHCGWHPGHLLVETSERQAPHTLEIFAHHGLVLGVAFSDELNATVVIGTQCTDEAEMLKVWR